MDSLIIVLLYSVILAETHKALENSIYSEPFKLIMEYFSLVSTAVGQSSVQLANVVQKNQDLADIVMLKNATEYVHLYEQYAVQVCNFVTIGGFSHVGTICR